MAVQAVGQKEFEAEVLQSPQPVLVDFWAAWCGPCQMMSPVVEGVAERHPGIRVCKVNTDENPGLALSLGIDGIPALLAYDHGQEVDRLVGYRPADALEAWLQEVGIA